MIPISIQNPRLPTNSVVSGHAVIKDLVPLFFSEHINSAQVTPITMKQTGANSYIIGFVVFNFRIFGCFSFSAFGFFNFSILQFFNFPIFHFFVSSSFSNFNFSIFPLLNFLFVDFSVFSFLKEKM